MATVELKAKTRETSGKGSARKARAAGLVPAVIYGEGEKPQALVIGSKDFNSVIHTTARDNVILDLKVEGAKQGEYKAIIREIQIHPVRREVLHVDFQHISMTKEITVNVPIKIVGESVGVKTNDGILELILREVEVECLPADIPDGIEMDVTELDIGNSLQVKDLHVENARIVSDMDSTVVTIGAPAVVEEPKAAAVVEGEEEKPAVVGAEEKKEEGPETKDEKSEK
ncbi:MAG: 50S ribosomal protein L25 [Candidatus Eisenbacteria bacterium]